jgi:uncharacterized damage-inducible protein DinB
MSIVDLLLPELDNEIAVTRRVLERVPDERGEWRPHPKAFPMAHLAQLVARLPSWTSMVMKQTEIDIAPTTGRKSSGYTIEKTATLLAELDKNAQEGRSALVRATDADFNVPWTLKKAGAVMLSTSRYHMLRSMVFNHLVHHRAQLGLYLRLADLTVPPMYGPTADDAT